MLALTGIAPSASAQAVRGLPAGWTMPDDATFAPSDKRWRYVAPEPRRGAYLHGSSGDLERESGIDKASGLKCDDSPTIRGAADPPGEEYWYFESDKEAVLLLKTNHIRFDDKCSESVVATYTVERATIRRDGFTRFIETGAGWRAETHRFAEYRRDDINDIGIGNGGWEPMIRFLVRKRRLDDSDVGDKIGKVQTHCVMYASPPDAGGGQCWSAGPGQSRGIVTSDYEIVAGSPYIFQEVTELEDDVLLDGRLFEWDRPIRKPS